MASYVYNPSAKVTELLSKFLEFDPGSLEMGIWSGDLSVKNVNLRRDAVKPLLNRKPANASTSTDATISSRYGSEDLLTASDPLQDPLKKAPLRVKLVKGTIGHLRMQIPWKQLVWGAGTVQIEVSDVEIVLSLQSREETAREEAQEALEEERKKKEEESVYEECEDTMDETDPGSKTGHKRKRRKKDGRSMIYHKAYREAKQRRLREAERRQLSNTGELASWLERLHQKQSIAKEAHQAEQKELGGTTTARKASQRYPLTGGTPSSSSAAPPAPLKEGTFDRYLKSFSSDFFWRMFAGVKGTISKARIVLLQDGVEVGCIVQSIEVLAGKDGIESMEIQSHHSNSHNSNNVPNANPAAATVAGSQNSSGGLVTAVDGPIDKMPLTAAFEDGEHIDKVLRQSGIGIFVRRETNRKQLTKIPNELRFSTSVEADDYILRPVAALNIGLSFFYPHPPERRKKIPATASVVTNATQTTAASTSASGTSKAGEAAPATAPGSVASSAVSSKRRRGKRDKEKPIPIPKPRPFIQTDLPNDESIAFDAALTPASAMTYFSDPRIPLDDAPELPSNASLGEGRQLPVRQKRTLSSDSDTFFSDPRVALDSPPPAPPSSTSPGRRKLRRTKSGGSPKKERRGRLRRTKSADSDDLFAAIPREDDDVDAEADAGSTDTDNPMVRSFSSGEDRRHPAQRLRTPLRGTRAAMVAPTPLMRGSTYPRVSSGGAASSQANLSNSVQNLNYAPASATVSEPYTPTVLPDLPATPCPRLQVRVGVDDVQVVFTNRHYELVNYLLCTVARMQNGRPDRTIRSVKVTEPGSELRELLKRKTEITAPNEGDASEVPQRRSSGISSYLWPTSSDGKADLRKQLTDQSVASGSFHDGSTFDDNLLYLRGKRLKSARQEVVAQWWKYAIGAIKWEIRKRKHMTSVFRQMYISFDWKKQRHRRQEYINAFIAKQNTKSPGNTSPISTRFHSSTRSNSSRVMNMLSASTHRTLRDIEDTLAEIEDELPIEQILLYRSIARSMRVLGVTEMPRSVYELWGKDGLTSAEITRKKHRVGTAARPSKYSVSRLGSQRTLNTSFESHVSVDNSADELEGDEGLLGKVQARFEKSRKLRDKDGVREYFAREAAGLNDAETIENPLGASGSLNEPGKIMRKPSKAAIEAGRFYSSNQVKKDVPTVGDIRSSSGGRTARSKMGRNSRSGITASTPGESRAPKEAAADVRMRLFFSFQMKKFNLIVVEEKGLYDLSPTNLSGNMVASSNRFLSPEATSVRDNSSVVSELSVLTDDQRFFGDEGSDFDRIVEEEEEDFEDAIGRPQFKSTDFLSFGQPENPLLRLTISSFIASSKGISGGGYEVGVSVGGIEVAGDEDTHILSIGPSEPPMPVQEVDIELSLGDKDQTVKRKLGAYLDGKSVGNSTFVSRDLQLIADGLVFTKGLTALPRHAISLKYTKGGPTKTLQCDLSKIKFSANVTPAEKLMRFYSRPEVKRPEKLLTKTSRDVARKIMVKKISNASTSKSLSSITSAIRIHGIEVKIPFSLNNGTEKESDSEDSDLDESFLLSNGSELPVGPTSQSYSTVLELDALELYSGLAVDELVNSAAMMSDTRDRSVASGSLGSTVQSQSIIRTLEMLDIAELTGAHDSFAKSHFVFTMRGMSCGIESDTTIVPNLMEVPINVEALITSNDLSLLDTENPKKQIVVEVSPVHFMVSEHRLELLSATNAALEFGKLGDGTEVIKKKIRPDPPRIEILSQRILSSLDINCHRLRIEFVKDKEVAEATLLPPKMKELVMEETLSDFLSIVACFDFNLPNEEALSSAMQVCIGRLVGLGLSDDEAWSCTNQARVNFLDDIARMRQTQTDVLEVMSEVISAVSSKSQSDGGSESDEGDDSDGSSSSTSSSDAQTHGDEFSDDDSNNSANMVETTINNAVERTVSAFSTFLRSFFEVEGQMDDSTYLFLDLPLGLSLSSINLFYDHHVTSLIPSLVATNKAGIELLTLVPQVKTDSSLSNTEENNQRVLNHGISFSRFNMDENHGFGMGGLPMSVLASDVGAESDLSFRKRSRFDDFQIGELEFFFSSSIFEEIIDEISLLLPKKSDDAVSGHDKHGIGDNSSQAGRLPVVASTVMMASSLSLLFTSEILVPFCRLTLENVCYKNKKAMESLSVPEMPSFALVASVFDLHNLSPEGQFYPDVLSLISPESSTGFPFQLRYFQSPDSWKTSSRLEIDFNSFRLFLVRRFINDLLHYFVYDKHGVGKLRKKYESNVVDIHGNGKPPLLYSIYLYDSSIICPRNSSSTDMVSFEVDDACIAVSYVPETFAMPTKSSPYWENPPAKSPQNPQNRESTGAFSRSNSFISVSDYEDCESFFSNDKSGPVSSHNKDLKRRFKIKLDGIQVFTALAGDKRTQDYLNSPLFRFIHTIDGRAEDSKEVYKKEANMEHSLKSENMFQFKSSIQSWEEISTNPFSLEVLFDSAPHTRLLVSCNDGLNPLSLDARLSQLCLLLSVWDSNMQELGTMFPISTEEVFQSARPPTIPDSFPAYCSKDFVSYLEGIESSIRSEICCMFKKISFRCTFDEPGYFSTDPNCFQYFEDPECTEDVKPGLVLSFEDMVVHVLNNHLNVKRIGIGASSINLTDERQVSIFQSTLSSDPVSDDLDQQISWADLSWGLREDIRTLGSSLPQPVQCSIFMTPGWSLINFGIDCANGAMRDLSWIWVLLDYFKSYYSNAAFGNLGFEAQKWTHRIKNALLQSADKDTQQFELLPGVNIDFRVWLSRPILCLPSDSVDPQAPSLVLSSGTGLWYRYKSIKDFSSQEVASTELNLSFANEFLSPEKFRRETNSGLSRTTGPIRPLIEGLSFGLRYDCNNKYHHKDVSVAIPFMGENIPSLSLDGKELEIDPMQLGPPKVLKPFRHRKRNFGPKACSITCLIEVLPLASATMMNFLTGPSEVNLKFAPKQDDGPPQTLSVSANLRDVRLFLIDPDLGVQLPIAVLSLASLSLSTSKFAINPVTEGLSRGESQPADMQIILKNSLWVDYFKLGLTRSWEPLLEPFEFEVLYETSIERGQGYSINSDCPLHFNLSGALLSFLSETIDSVGSVIKETFGKKDGRKGTRRKESTMVTSFEDEDEGGTHLKDIVNGIDGREMNIIHEIPKPLKAEDRVAFSLRNLTGQRIRIHQQSNFSSGSDHPVVVTYLNQGESSGLSFAATISVVKNMRIVEVPYPGFEVSEKKEYQQQGSLNHAIDLQVPGCRWIQGVKVDSFGRKFQSLTPRSSQVWGKISKDWRLRNAMTLLTEVGPDNGGRLLSVRSIFEIRNNTTHSVNLVFHPDPRYKPDIENEGRAVDLKPKGAIDETKEETNSSEYAVIEPGCDFQLPTLLIESSLEMDGSHLGSVWVRPDTSNTEIFSFRDFTKPTDSKVEKFDASFCSRPVQLARIVHETSHIYEMGEGKDIEPSQARSGVQVSCATHSQNENIRTPFCYAIEIARSPIVKSSIDAESSPDVKDGLVEKNKKKRKPDHHSLIHGPVAYTLTIHPPIVIVNLLPEGGRFELMHAIRKTVVWYADLEPGQQVPIHSLGLDVPLLLLVNLGFCRTPIGEGALVHHGGTLVDGRGTNAGLKSFGKAVTKGTKKIGRTLTTLADSTDKRAQERVAKVVSPKAKKRRRRKGNVKHMRSSVQNESLGLDIGHTESDRAGGKVHAIEGVTYSAADIADETTVVDSVGQRLALQIENIRGGGGQRRISLYCPFWIVNTTEHALRYKEDKEKEYVCGTVISPEKDGSMPVDGCNRQYRARYEMQSKRRAAFASPPSLVHTGPVTNDAPMNPETVFAGTHGALATSPGKCNLSPENISSLIDQDISLEKLAKIAFMFNFHEYGMGSEKLMIQLYDGLRSYKNNVPDYTSGWSTGFGLESVGFSQVIRIPCKDGRVLELSATVNVAPGFLSGYTKIVRFSPRYAIYNRLERPIRLWQDSSIVRSLSEERSNGLGDTSDSRKWRYEFEDKRHVEKISQYESIFGRHAVLNDRRADQHAESSKPIPEATVAHRSALYISSVGPSQLVPFFLPDTRSDSQLRIDVGGHWNLTSSFASNIPGEYVLPISRATDIRMLNHVSTRDAPKYKIILPPPGNEDGNEWDGELGAYFETEYVSKGDRKILVKGTKRGKYAFNHTDMHVGDELLRINGISVMKMTFQEAMETIKNKLSDIRAYQEKMKQKENFGHTSIRNPKGVLKRLSLGARQNSLPNSDRNNVNRGLKRLSLGARKQSSSELEEEIIRPPPLTMTFRTQEERLRKMRIKAITSRNSVHTIGNIDREDSDLEAIDALTVETKALHNTMFVILRHADKENPPFKIQNRSLKYFLFYRQRSCEDHEWSVLAPGESRSYCWEEPMKSKKLTVRIAADAHGPPKESCGEMSPGGESKPADRKVDFDVEPADRLKQVLAYQYVDNEERGGFGPPTTVRLEEIGFQAALPVPSFMEGIDQNTKYLNCEVDTDGGTRLLVVSDLGVEHDERQKMHLNLESLKKQIGNEEKRKLTLQAMRHALSNPVNEKDTKSVADDQVAEKDRTNIIENELRELVEDFPEGNSISKRCQVVVQVLEAVGLRSSDFVGSCNPYCEVFYKGRSRSRKHFLQKRKNKRKTYFMEKTANPRWNDQYFVFDVPEAAIEVNRGHSIKVVVRDFRAIGQHPILGQASLYFESIRDQQESVGWWPLVGKYRNSDLSVERMSDFGRGSIKLRAQWIYTLPAMIDYYSLLSQRRWLALTKTQIGMQEQLKSAEESFQRKREAIDRLPGSRIAKLVKLKKKTFSNRDAALKRELQKTERQSKVRSPLNTNFLQLKDTLKLTRKQSMNVLTLQTVESKRKRQLVLEEIRNNANVEEGSRSLRMLSASSRSAEKEIVRAMTPTLPVNSRDRTKSLGDFFAQQRGSTRSRRTSEWNAALHKSHRKLSLELDDPYMVESIMDCIMMESPSQLENNMSSRQALHSSRRQSKTLSQHSDTWISDLISVNTDGNEQARRKNDIARLKALGFVFHESGMLFHEDHLPNHFRRLLFASVLEERKSQLFHSRKFYVGTSSSIRQFKNWQAASALLYDPDVDVVQTKKSFLVQLSGKMAGRNDIEETKIINTGKSIISQKLSVPDEAPSATIQRSKYRIEAMHRSRTLFDRSCRRILGCVLNPGGWLTVRPIVAMNLPDSYNGMFVKVSHGSDVQVSETVDAKVSPKWSSVPSGSLSASKVKGRRRSTSTQQPNTATATNFDFSENDLHLHVEPQQTGGSIRLSVVAMRYKTKVELGVVHIPLGAAIAACIDAAQDVELSGNAVNSVIPMYTRWFPLMEPHLTVPVAGDMGLSARPDGNEQLRDNMFQYAPCIQLSLMWWPHDQNKNENKDRVDADSDVKAATKMGSSVVSQITHIPSIQTYFNADISAVSMALIDSVRAVELLNLSLRDIDMKYAVTKTKTRIGLVVGWIQMDQQDNSRESVIFAPTPTEYLQPTLQFLALKDNVRTKSNILSYEYVGVALQEMDLTVEEPSVYELWDFFMAVMARKKMKERAEKGQKHAHVVSRNANVFHSFELDDANPALFEILQSAGNRGALSEKQKMYVEQLILGLVKINLSYVKGRKQNFEVADNSRNAIQNFTITTGRGQMIDDGAEKKNDQSELFTRWSQLTSGEDSVRGSTGSQNNLPSIIAALFPSVSDAPIRLQGKLVEHVFESPIEIASSLKNYYTNETLKQVYKIIGSLDLVGNPTILLSSFMSGVKDLVSIPTAAFMKSPANVKQVGIGVGKGTVSFLSHSASGIFGLTARLLSQAGQGMALMSFDSEYRQWHRDRVVNEATNLERAWKRRGMPTAEEIFLRPVADIVLGFTLGVSGVVMSPYRGARKSGVKGLVVGTGKGVAGLVTKPIVGVLDAMTHGSQSFHDIAKTANFLERRYQPVLKLRLPHVFGPMKILMPFDLISARSVYLLGLFPPKTKLKHRLDKGQELHVHSEVLNMEPGVETYAIATNIRVVLIKLRRDANSLAPSFGWEVELTSGARISSRISDHGHNGVALTITKSANWTPPQTGKLSKKMSEITMKTRKLSMASSHASVHIPDEEDEEAGELGDNLESIHLSANSTSAKPLSESLSAGVTKKGNETLEWFTVLAEYQQRKQLTHLHNAISCILGDYDDIISDRSQAQSSPKAMGTTSFGIYNFEKGLPDGRAAKLSNTKVVASLENLYWLESNLVQRIGRISSPDRKQRALNRIRSDWDFSKDMKASESIGGPEWLVVARAKAMCISKEFEEAENRLSILDDTEDSGEGHRAGRQFFPEKNPGPRSSVSSAIQYESSEGVAASRQSSVSVGHFSQSANASITGQGPSMASSSTGDRGHTLNTTSSTWNATFSHSAIASRAPQHQESLNAGPTQDSNAIVEDFYSPINGMVTGSGRIEVFNDEPHRPPVPSLDVPAPQASNQDNAHSINASIPRTVTATASFESSRIDRLEGVMEQLLILNATQARQAVNAPETRHAAAESSPAQNIADALMQELTDIREKMDARAREDEALRQEIGMLRDQLVEKQEKRSSAPGMENTGVARGSAARRPPPINTQFLKPRSIRGLFKKSKSKKKNRSEDESIDRNEGNSLPVGDSHSRLPSVVSNDNRNLGTLGLDDERSGSQSMQL